VPKPDPNPLDCDEDVGHGSHVAGTAAGFGVLANGNTYSGPYDTSTYPSNDFRIGPGVAPKADLYAIRVFGCVGSTDLVGEALEWAIENDMDVVNMSLGSPFGSSDGSDAVATDNAVKAGIAVVASAGNNADLRYITGTPGAAERAISVAASDTPSTVPFANIALPASGSAPAETVSALVANGATYASPLNLTVKVVRDTTQPGGVSLGCSVADFQANGGVAGKVAVVQRGVCARVAKAIYAQQAGAAAVVTINNSTALPPYESAIFQNPDTGEFYNVTIPMLGVRGLVTTATSDGAKIVARDNMPVSITTTQSQATGTATFSSGGPRSGDSFLKPDVTAPGSPTVSTLVGSGNLQESLSGTSMAAPHVAGVAALVRQAHPSWTPADIKAAIMNTANPEELADYSTRRDGAGFVNAAAATQTSVIAFADREAVSASFGFEELASDLNREMLITLRNLGSADAVFLVRLGTQQGAPHNVSFNRSRVRVPANGRATVRMTLNVPAGTVGNSDDFRDVAGLVTFTPVANDNGEIPLRVPYYLVSRASANLTARFETPITTANPTSNLRLSNSGGVVAASADIYTWGLVGPRRESVGILPTGFNLSAAGAQSFDVSATEKGIAFAIDMEQSWSSPNMREFDVHIDSDRDGITDYVVVGIDLGLITTGSFDGRIVSSVYKRNANDVFVQQSIDFVAVASTDSSTLILPVLASSIGVTPANPRFLYDVVAFNLDTGQHDQFDRMAAYNAFTKAVSDGAFVTVPPGGTVNVPITVNFTELAQSPALGVMIAAPDNKNGGPEAVLVPLQ
jgi:subtilisin family serine protease